MHPCMGGVLLWEQDIDVTDLPDSLMDTHNHPGLFQFVQGTLAGLGASGECRRYLHDGEAHGFEKCYEENSGIQGFTVEQDETEIRKCRCLGLSMQRHFVVLLIDCGLFHFP